MLKELYQNKDTITAQRFGLREDLVHIGLPSMCVYIYTSTSNKPTAPSY
jgi:hypothetical protein